MPSIDVLGAMFCSAAVDQDSRLGQQLEAQQNRRQWQSSSVPSSGFTPLPARISTPDQPLKRPSSA
jgi:hypothetical protein